MSNRILRTPADLNADDIRALYAGFDVPVTDLDCASGYGGQMTEVRVFPAGTLPEQTEPNT